MPEVKAKSRSVVEAIMGKLHSRSIVLSLYIVAGSGGGVPKPAGAPLSYD